MQDNRYTQRIISHLSDQRYRPRRPGELAEDLSIPAEDLVLFHQTIDRLVEQGRAILGASDTIALPPPGRNLAGAFRLHERGFGFITPDSPMMHGDLFVPEGNTGGAMTGDHVIARVIHQKNRATEGRSPFIGTIIQITKRADKKYTGNLTKRGSHFVVEIDGNVLRLPVVVGDPHAKNAKIGDKVVVELIEFPTENAPATGVITEVLGEQGEPDVETRAVMRSFGLEEKFSEDVFADARAAAQSFNDKTIPPDREDLTGEFITTIDPPDAKDYDDAISIKKIVDGGQSALGSEGRLDAGSGSSTDHSSLSTVHYELGVHIADVSHFVKLGTALDAEARKRGNSAYLPRRVIPMLPETLSNGVCSLQEGVNRYCKSAFIRYDAQGHVVSARFANTVIRSAKRMTYLEAQALIEGDLREAKRHAKTEPKYPTKLSEKLRLMDELARIIRARRQREGMITLGLPEVELVFDDSGRVVDAKPEDDAFTHTLIEMFMVEANEAAARLFDSLHIPMIRRIHPDPDAHDITELRTFARVAGFNIPSRPSRRELQTLLDGVRGKPAQYAVHLAVLKTLSKAEYSPLLIGHFALASKHYTHFTSPIRRYADLVVHRGLDAYFAAQSNRPHGAALPLKSEIRDQRSEISSAMRSDPRCPAESELMEIGQHCSATERNAEGAEDELRSFLVLDFLSTKLGEDFEGTVTGVTGRGIFVQIDRFLIDGFVKSTDLPGAHGDFWKLNRTTGALVAQRSGKTVTIGDRFMVRIAKVNPVARQMDLVVTAQISGPGKAKANIPGNAGTSGNPGSGDDSGNLVNPGTPGAPGTPGTLGTPATRGGPPRRQPFGARRSHQDAMKLKRQRQQQRKNKRRR